MRQGDVDEVRALTGRGPTAALMASYRASSCAWTWVVDGKPEGMFGVGDLNVLAGLGAPWFLGTDAVEEHGVEFLRRSVTWRDQLLGRYHVLRNLVDLRNTTSIRWLQWLGAAFTQVHEIRGQEFLLFEMRRSDV